MSKLFDRAIKARAAALGNALDASGFTHVAYAAGAGLAFAVIDREMVLKITEFSVGLPIIAQARPTGLDRGPQDFTDGGDQPSDVRLRAFTSQPLRVNARVKQRLAGVDITNAGDDALIHQRIFDAGLL